MRAIAIAYKRIVAAVYERFGTLGIEFPTRRAPAPKARARFARPADEDLTAWEMECSYESSMRELDRYLDAHRAEVQRLSEGKLLP